MAGSMASSRLPRHHQPGSSTDTDSSQCRRLAHDSNHDRDESDYEANNEVEEGDTGSGAGSEPEDGDQHGNTGGSGGEGEEDGDNDEHGNEAGESDIQAPEVKVGQKRKASTAGKLKTPARQGTSTPASENKKDAPTQGNPKRLKGALVFEELVKTEEKTRQMELQVEAEKVRFNTVRVEAKMQREKIKMEHEKNKLELLRLKLELRKEETRASEHRMNAPPMVNPLFSIPSSSGFSSGSQTPMSHPGFPEDAYGFGGLEMGDSRMSDST